MKTEHLFIPELPNVDQIKVKETIVDTIHHLEVEWLKNRREGSLEPEPSIHELVDLLVDDIKDDPMNYPICLVEYMSTLTEWQLVHAFKYSLIRSYQPHSEVKTESRNHN